MKGLLSDAVCTTWSELSLDSRILEAIRHLKWRAPTAVQGACIPLALKGRDMALQSRTGSGKTGAFIIPILQHIITKSEQMCGRRATRNPLALILLPSVELCEQTVEVSNALATYVKPRIVVDNLTSREVVTKARIASAPIIVSTVALLGKHCRNGTVTADELKSLLCVVIDEADLVMSVAESSLRAVQSVLPSSVQTILSSATLTDGVISIKRQLLHNPITITLKTDDEDKTFPTEGEENIIVEAHTTTRGDSSCKKLKHYYLVATDECHHHTLIYALYRLGHISGKTLLFVNDEDAMYRLQNFFAQLGVDALVYDTNLPLNVRIDTLHRFQTGAVGTLICTDGTLDSVDKLQDASLPNKSKKAGRRAAEGKSVGPLQRGIDFADVRNVILFDGVSLPTTSAFSRYTHRVGRAGRAGKGGLAITLFSIQQARRVTKPLRDYLAATNTSFNPFKQLERKEATKLQYRVDNVLASITRSSTRRQRVAAVATELTRSAYLTNHMSLKDGSVLQSILSKSKKATKCDPALLDIPHYMHIEGADSTERYRKRVHSSASSTTSSLQPAKKKPLDPLSRVATSIRSGSTRKQRP